MTAIWNATGVTPAATNRLPVDVSSSGGASRVTMQQLADLGVLVGESHNALGTISSGTNDIDLFRSADSFLRRLAAHDIHFQQSARIAEWV